MGQEGSLLLRQLPVRREAGEELQEGGFRSKKTRWASSHRPRNAHSFSGVKLRGWGSAVPSENQSCHN